MSRTVKVGPVVIATMKKESRELLDKLMDEFESANNEKVMDVSGYTMLYWLTRYSSVAEKLVEAKKLRRRKSNW